MAHFILARNGSINRIDRVRKAARLLALIDPPLKFAVRVIKAISLFITPRTLLRAKRTRGNFGDFLLSTVTIVLVRAVKLAIVLNDNFYMVFSCHEVLVLFRHAKWQGSTGKREIILMTRSWLRVSTLWSDCTYYFPRRLIGRRKVLKKEKGGEEKNNKGVNGYVYKRENVAESTGPI